MTSISPELLKMIIKLAGRQTGRINKVDPGPRKPEFRNTPIRQPFPRAVPESQGVSSAWISDFLKELREDPETEVHQVMIARHGKVIAECGFAPYKTGTWHVTHSLCKSYTGMAVGILAGEGKLKLSETLEDIFPEYCTPVNRTFKKKITVRNLLEMKSGVSFDETGAVTENNWISGFMNARRKCDPGTKFDYNSMNSYMLSAIVGKRTGIPMDRYLKKKLFDPMGIEEVFWERGPEGIPKGGWGMYIRPEDALKTGELYLRGGSWNGEQLIPEKWVRESVKLHSDNGKYGYGWHIWLTKRSGGFAYEGLFGQYVAVYPDLDMVFCVTAGNSEVMKSGHLTEIIRRRFCGDFASSEALPEDSEAYAHLQNRIREYETVPKLPQKKVIDAPVPKASPAIDGDTLAEILKDRYFIMAKGNIGLFPLVSQVLHCNYTEGIKEIGFEKEGGDLVLILMEYRRTGMENTACYSEHRIRIGFGGYAESKVRLNGEIWQTAAIGRVLEDVEGRIVLSCSIAFPEDACTRTLAFTFDGDDLILRAQERPGEEVIREELSTVRENLEKRRTVGKWMKAGGSEILEAAALSAAAPSDCGHLIR